MENVAKNHLDQIAGNEGRPSLLNAAVALICVAMICITAIWCTGNWVSHARARYTFSSGGDGSLAYMVDQETGEIWLVAGYKASPVSKK